MIYFWRVGQIIKFRIIGCGIKYWLGVGWSYMGIDLKCFLVGIIIYCVIQNSMYMNLKDVME